MGRIKIDQFGPGVYQRIYPVYKNCLGCRTCEIRCGLTHYGTINPELSRIRVHSYRGIDVPILCKMCKSPRPCLEACPVQAISVDEETGANIVDTEMCTGCGECEEECPARAIRFHPIEKYALICDLCGGDPECVKACPEKCLEFIVGPADYIPPDRYAYPAETIVQDLRNTSYYHKERGGR